MTNTTNAVPTIAPPKESYAAFAPSFTTNMIAMNATDPMMVMMMPGFMGKLNGSR